LFFVGLRLTTLENCLHLVLASALHAFAAVENGDANSRHGLPKIFDFILQRSLHPQEPVTLSNARIVQQPLVRSGLSGSEFYPQGDRHDEPKGAGLWLPKNRTDQRSPKIMNATGCSEKL